MNNVSDEGLNSMGRQSNIDIARGIGMIMIIWGHLSYIPNPISNWFSASKIVVFYIISGLLLSLKETNNSLQIDNKKSIVSFVKKKALTFGIPYLFYSLLALIANILVSLFDGSFQVNSIIRDIVYLVTFRGISTLWFLPTLFLAEVVFILLYCHCRNVMKFLIIFIPIICLIIIYLYIFISFRVNDSILWDAFNCFYAVFFKSLVAYWFLLVGYYIGKKKYIYNNLVVLVLLGVINIFLSFINKNVDFNVVKLGDFPILFFMNGVLGSVLIIGISYKLNKNRILEFIGFNSLFIMVTHLPWKICYILTLQNKSLFQHKSASVNYYISIVLEVIICLLIEFLLIKGKKKLLNKKYENNNTVFKNILRYL